MKNNKEQHLSLGMKRSVRICYVSNTGQSRPYEDGSTRYRCYYPIETLRAIGYYAGMVAYRDYWEISPQADAYIFHRPVYSDRLADEIERLKTAGAIVIADYDDLIFGVENMSASSLYKNNLRSLPLSSLFYDNTRALRLFDIVSVSTPVLGDYVRKYHKSAHVILIRNGLPEVVRDHGRLVSERKVMTQHAFGYFPGTKTHDKDYLTWSDALKEAIVNSSYRLTVMGELSPQLLIDVPRVHQVPGNSFMNMISQMAEVSVALAPLEESVFNKCKSNIKSIEAFSTGCHSITTRQNDTSILFDQGAEILIVDDPSQLVSAIEDVKQKPIISRKNIELVNDLYSVKNVLNPLLSFL